MDFYNKIRNSVSCSILDFVHGSVRNSVYVSALNSVKDPVDVFLWASINVPVEDHLMEYDFKN